MMTDNVNIENVYENKFLGVILNHQICSKFRDLVELKTMYKARNNLLPGNSERGVIT